LAVPVTVDSAFVTGGTSFAGDSAAVNTGLFGDDGVDGDVELLLHPAARRLSATAIMDNCFIV